jgi:hypothetical protein
MVRQADWWKRAARRLRWLTAGTGTAVAVASLSWSIARADSTAAGLGTDSARAPFARLADIPSHNASYRASLVPSRAWTSDDRAVVWTIAVTTADGAPVEHAALSLESWMPDADGITRYPRVTQALGRGRYRVEGLRIDRAGWWNIKLQISAAGTTDSLAFNLVR